MNPKDPPKGERRVNAFVTLNKAVGEVREDFQKFVDAVNRKLRRFFIGVLIVLSVVGLSSAAALGGFAFVLKKQGGVADEIQQQRYDSLVSSCTQQNQRHIDTIAVAEERYEKGQLTEQGLVNTKFLVDKLAPFVKDCTKNANKRVKEVEK